MNTKMIRFIWSRMLGAEALLLLIPALVGGLYGESAGGWFVLTALLPAGMFLLWGRRRPSAGKIYAKEGMVIVGGAWLLWSVFGALPGFLSGAIPSYIDAFFETMSGFTTTGSTILDNIEVLPRCMLFWRSFTHWIGGMGVLLFVMMLGTLDKNNAMHLMRAEMPGPEADKLLPRARDTARLLYGIYLGLTVLLCLLLKLGGLSFYDSLVHAFGTAGTGGFSNYAASVGYFHSAYVEWLLTIFMALFGVNFNIYFLLLLREFKPVWKNEELRVYFGLIIAATLLVAFNTLDRAENFAEALRTAAFQVVSVITTTGFASVEYSGWPTFSLVILLVLMFIGACASSTGGGAKVSRLIILVKSVKNQIRELVHPQSVNLVRVSGRRMSREVLAGVYGYFVAYFLVFVVSLLLVSLDGKDFGTTFSAVLTTLGNVGPGLGDISPSGSFSGFSALSKIVLSFDMLAGRLEFFPFFILFTAPAWRKKF